jgi:hypothetical protein
MFLTVNKNITEDFQYPSTWLKAYSKHSPHSYPDYLLHLYYTHDFPSVSVASIDHLVL